MTYGIETVWTMQSGSRSIQIGERVYSTNKSKIQTKYIGIQALISLQRWWNNWFGCMLIETHKEMLRFFTWFFSPLFLFVAFVGVSSYKCWNFVASIRLYTIRHVIIKILFLLPNWCRHTEPNGIKINCWRYYRSFLLLLICQYFSGKARELESGLKREREREVQLHRLMRKLNRLQKFIQYLFD